MQNIHLEVLDKDRINVLGKLSNFKDIFYLAGGTGLALMLGHRDSIDFDFFTKESFDENMLVEKISNVFKGNDVKVIQLERGTVTALINNSIKISFFNYKYELVNKLVETDFFNIASILDIACMKLSAICSRSTNKDYVDLYFILKENSLKDLLLKSKIKFENIDRNVMLKSLVFFEDIVEEPLKMILEKDLKLIDVQNFLNKKVRDYYL